MILHPDYIDDQFFVDKIKKVLLNFNLSADERDTKIGSIVFEDNPCHIKVYEDKDDIALKHFSKTPVLGLLKLLQNFCVSQKLSLRLLSIFVSFIIMYYAMRNVYSAS